MKVDIAIMSPITQKLDALLKAEGFTVLETQRTIGGNDQFVNELSYMREEWERVYIFTHEKTEGKTA
jgi:hypothetical protein